MESLLGGWGDERTEHVVRALEHHVERRDDDHREHRRERDPEPDGEAQPRGFVDGQLGAGVDALRERAHPQTVAHRPAEQADPPLTSEGRVRATQRIARSASSRSSRAPTP